MAHKTRGRSTISDAILLTPITGTTGAQGVVYYDSVLNKLRVHDGGSFVDLASEDYVDTAVTDAANLTFSRLAEVTLGVAGATLSASVPSGYRHFRVYLFGVTSADISSGQPVKVTVNGITTNYWGRLLRATAATFNSTSETTGLLLISDNTGCRNISAYIDIICPSGQTKRMSAEMHVDDSPTSSTSYIGFARATQTSTAEVTSIEITITSNTFTTASRMVVYGAQ